MAKPKALILDPIYSLKDPLTQVKILISDHISCEIVQLSFDASQSNPTTFGKFVYDAVRDADLIFCFGDFFWFRFLDCDGDKFYQEFERKFSAGTPLFLQIPRIYEAISNQNDSKFLKKFMRRIEVIPTEYRVFSELDYLDSHVSGRSCWFRKADKCVINPLVFQGVEKFLLSNGNKIEYEGETFPVAETSPLHFLVTRSDLKHIPPSGTRNCVAALRNMENEFVLIFSGEVFNDPYENIGGTIHGIDLNLELAKQVLEVLAKKVKSAVNSSVTAYRDFFHVETGLSTLIQRRLFDGIGECQIQDKIPPRALQNMSVNGEFHYECAYYSDLVEIVLLNWIVFEPAFGMSKNKFKNLFYGLNNQRRALAHPHNFSVSESQFSDYDLVKIVKARNAITSALAVPIS